MAQLLPLSPVPLYSQLKELLRTRILDGTYPPLARMPSENDPFGGAAGRRQQYPECR